MIGYWCEPCQMYFRKPELRKDGSCPEDGSTVKPRLLLGGQVMGSGTSAKS